MHRFEYFRPRSLMETISLLEEYGTRARMLAGGTDLTVGLRHGHFHPDAVIDLKQVSELAPSIVVTADAVEIAASTVLMQIIRHETMRRHFPALVEAADVVGSRQIRNRATLAGNICNASPAADTVPVLAVYGAMVIIFGPAGERRIPVTEFIQGNRKIDLAKGELVTGVHLPLPKLPYGAAFDRITRRRGVDLATVNLCCGIGPNGRAVLALGAASPRPMVVHDVDGVFSDLSVSQEDRMAALTKILKPAAPISDVRASAQYRHAMLTVMAQRSLIRANQRLEESKNYA